MEVENGLLYEHFPLQTGDELHFHVNLPRKGTLHGEPLATGWKTRNINHPT